MVVWLLLPELISQESERGGEMSEELLAEFQGNILSFCWGLLLLFVGWHSQKQVPPPALEKMET